MENFCQGHWKKSWVIFRGILEQIQVEIHVEILRDIYEEIVKKFQKDSLEEIQKPLKKFLKDSSEDYLEYMESLRFFFSEIPDQILVVIPKETIGKNSERIL